ncbi:MAG: hypothetical protein COB69_09205 [Phycisphaera sp.]|nr:MAG: hypothetical protein COB69_09205 [Phycisphaera sp.]
MTVERGETYGLLYRRVVITAVARLLAILLFIKSIAEITFIMLFYILDTSGDYDLYSLIYSIFPEHSSTLSLAIVVWCGFPFLARLALPLIGSSNATD